MSIGKQIKQLRKVAGLKQRELADMAEISPSMLSLVEAGRREPTISLLRDISDALGIPTSVLLLAAVADERSNASAVARHTARMTDELFDAARHFIRAKRLRDDREKRPKSPTRKSA